MVVLQTNMTTHPELKPKSEVTFVEALKNRYVHQEIFDNRVVLLKNEIISTDITLVGFDKVSNVQRQLKRLVSIDLSGMSISCAGCTGELEGALNRVQLINLADNLLTWSEVTDIFRCMPNVREIILTGNPLTAEKSDLDLPEPIFKSLKNITLGRIYLNWAEIVEILSTIWTSIDEIDLWSNKLTHESIRCCLTDRSRKFIQSIKCLKVSHNEFVDTDWIKSIGRIANITELDLSNCKLKSVTVDDDIADQLRMLTTLNISYNDIDGWQSISCLHRLTSLTNLICHENPFYLADKLAKQLVIGRLPNLGMLNREEITGTMRRDSEILYLRKTFPNYLLFKQGRMPDFARDNPTYDRLIEIYGIPEDLNKKELDDKYIDIEFCLGDKRSLKKLPCDMRIANVHMLCKKLFRIRPSSNLRLTCRDPKRSDMDYELDKDGQTLHFFSVKSGHQLVITELDN